MAREDGYQRKIAPEAAAPLPLASPETFGAGVAGALGDAAEMAHRGDLRAYQIQRQLTAASETTDVAHHMALNRQNIDQIIDTLRNNPGDPSYSDHLERTQKAFQAGREHILDGVTEDSVRRETSRQLDDEETRLLAGEQSFVTAQRAAKTAIDTRRVLDAGANRIQANPGNAQVFAQEMEAGRNLIANLSGHADQKTIDTLTDEFNQGHTVAYSEAMIETNPQGWLKQADAGYFDKLVTAPQMAQLRSGAQVEIRRQDAQAQQAVAGEKAKFEQDYRIAKEASEHGIDVSASLPELKARAARLGLDDKAFDLDLLANDSKFAKVYNGQTPLQRQAAIQELTAILPAKRTPAQQQELEWLNDHNGPLSEQYNSSKADWIIRNAPRNVQPPPLSEGLPARQHWANSLSGAYGEVPMFTDAEALERRERAQSGAQGQLEVANELNTITGTNAQMNAARQVDPGDAMLRTLTRLGPQDAALVQMGAQVRAGNKTLIDGENGTDARAAFDSHNGRALELWPPADVNASFDASRSIYANEASRSGALAYDRRKFAGFMDRGLGRTIGAWRSNKVALPENYDQARFTAVLNAYKPNGGPRAPAFPPREPGGKPRPMTGDELRNYVPVARPDGLYQFRGPNDTTVQTLDGHTFVMQFTPRRKP